VLMLLRHVCGTWPAAASFRSRLPSA